MGQITANIFVKYGYSVILIDANLQKLQTLKLQLQKTFVEVNPNILILQFDMCIYKDSTTIEQQIREVVDVEMDIPIIVNTSGYGGYWQVAEDKLYHELQFDQLIYYHSQTILGFSLILQFFSRLVFHKKTNCLILNI